MSFHPPSSSLSQSIISPLEETHGTLAYRSFHFNKLHSLEHFLSSVPPLMVPGSQSRPPLSSALTHPLFPPPSHPGAYLQASVAPTQFPDQSPPAVRTFPSGPSAAAAALGLFLRFGLCRAGRRTGPTRRTLINPAESGEPSASSMRNMGGKEKKVLMITNAPNHQG